MKGPVHHRPLFSSWESGSESIYLHFVLGRMEQRMAVFGKGWQDATAVQLYTVFDPHPFMGDEIVHRGAAEHGLTWHFARPPVEGLDYEMDCRAVALERRVSTAV